MRVIPKLSFDQWLEVLTLSILLGFPLIWFSLTFYDSLYKHVTNDARIARLVADLSK